MNFAVRFIDGIEVVIFQLNGIRHPTFVPDLSADVA